MTGTELVAVSTFADMVEKLGPVGLMTIFCIYMIYINNRDKKQCKEIYIKLAEKQEELTENVLTLEKTLAQNLIECANKKQQESEYRLQVLKKLDRLLENVALILSNSLSKRELDKLQRREIPYNV